MMRYTLERFRILSSCSLIVATCATGALWHDVARAQVAAPERPPGPDEQDAQFVSGPLTVHPTNPRYFADATGNAVYLTGSHTWSNLQDEWTNSYPASFDFEAYLDLLEENNHNFIRLWRWELPQYMYEGDAEMRFSEPHPWVRVGATGTNAPRANATAQPTDVGGESAQPALVPGEGQFNLAQFNQSYFDRLRERVESAGQRGMYVSIMLFEGHGVGQAEMGWASHPFNAANNVNGIDGDGNGDGQGIEIHTMENPDVLAIQEAYVKKIVDTVNDLDNVLFEIANESTGESVEWQNHMIALIKSYEQTMPQQHPVLFTTPLPTQSGVSESIWTSDADAVSPISFVEGDETSSYADNPPAADGAKVVISDSDHIFGCGGTTDWVWKSFSRGLNVIYMDSYYEDTPFCPPPSEGIRANLGATRHYAQRMNLAQALPMGELASSGYALADVGDSYLVYLPDGGSVTVDLSHASGANEASESLPVEWFNPQTNEAVEGSPVGGGAKETLTAPFDGPAVLFVGGAAAPVDIPTGPTLPPPDSVANVDDDGDASAPPSSGPNLPTIDDEGDIGGGVGVTSDLDGNGRIDIDDVKLLVQQWGDCASDACPADLDRDGRIDLSDVILILQDWTG